MINEHASNLRCMSDQAHEWGDQNWADKLRQAANELDRLTRDRDHLLEIREQLVGQREWASQQIDRLTRERDEARAAIKDAYGEGWSDGGHSAESLYAGYGSHDFDAAWLASDAMRAADEALATEAAQ